MLLGGHTEGCGRDTGGSTAVPRQFPSLRFSGDARGGITAARDLQAAASWGSASRRAAQPDFQMTLQPGLPPAAASSISGAPGQRLTPRTVTLSSLSDLAGKGVSRLLKSFVAELGQAAGGKLREQGVEGRPSQGFGWKAPFFQAHFTLPGRVSAAGWGSSPGGGMVEGATRSGSAVTADPVPAQGTPAFG